jgi:PhoH-like ATPase
MTIEKKIVSKKVTEETAPQKTNQKMYVLDTNVLLHDPQAFFAFPESFVGISYVVLEELDKFKREGTDRGRNSRYAIKTLDGLRQRGSLANGVSLDNRAVIFVFFFGPEDFASEKLIAIADNMILHSALALKRQGYDVCFVSKDLNARVKADALGVCVQDYYEESVTPEEFYRGWVTLQVPSIALKSDEPKILEEYSDQLMVNEYVLLESQNNPYNYRIFRYLGRNSFRAVHPPQLKWPLRPKNPQQIMAMDALFDDDITLVCLFGPAGTGKTFLALLAGLHEVLVDDEYEKILVSRPVTPLGRDIGYLPGTVEEKLHSWMLPVYDNMQFIVHAAHMQNHVDAVQDQQQSFKEGKHRKRNGYQQPKRDVTDLKSLDALIKTGKINLEAITYMRGRSIPYQFIIIDEAQNLTPHELKTLVTRVGERSKVVIVGDPYQIDVPYLDFASNGLIYVSERFKGQPIFSSVYLEKGERSEISELASKLL